MHPPPTVLIPKWQDHQTRFFCQLKSLFSWKQTLRSAVVSNETVLSLVHSNARAPYMITRSNGGVTKQRIVQCRRLEPDGLQRTERVMSHQWNSCDKIRSKLHNVQLKLLCISNSSIPLVYTVGEPKLSNQSYGQCTPEV